MIISTEELFSNTNPRLIVCIVFLRIFTTSIMMYSVDMCTQLFAFSVA